MKEELRMNQEYDRIVSKINEAQYKGDIKKEKYWISKLRRWQQAYGAYAPIR